MATPDREKLRHAVNWVTAMVATAPPGALGLISEGHMNHVVAAARAVLEAPEITWCEKHDAPLWPETATHVGPQSNLHRDHCWFTADGDRNQMAPCRMTRAFLVPSQEKETT